MGIIITLAFATIRAGFREAALRKQIREKISEAVQKTLREMQLVQAQAMRASIKKGFDGLEQTIVGNINEEIAIVRAALDEIVEKKKHAEYSAAAEKLRLGELRAAAGQHAERLRGLLAVA